MGETKTPHFYDFRIFEPVTRPNKQLFLSSETPGHLTTNPENPINLQTNSIFINIKMLAPPQNDMFGKDGHRQMMNIRLTHFRKPWIWDQSVPENMK